MKFIREFAATFACESKTTDPSDGPEDTYSDRLQFVPQEEGRIRYVPGNGFSTASQPKFAYDYFLKDHLGNVRAVITEGNSAAAGKESYKATYEPGADSAETALFGDQAGLEYARASVTTPQLVECTDCAVPQNTPNTTLNYNDPNIYDSAQTNVPSEKVAKLNGSSKKIGTSLILKVMAGDHFDLSVKAWFPDKESPSDKVPDEDVLQTLLNTLSGNASSIPGNHTAEEIGGTTSPLLPGLLSFLQSHPDSAGDPKDPAAYINWVLFDENFHYVPEGSGFKKVESYTTDMQLLQQDSTEVTKNGFLFVYLSNETQHYDVFFDDMLVNYSPGPLLEETHYYPFGLVMSGISSQAAGSLANKHLYSGKELQSSEFSDGSGLEAYDFGARMYDAQTGRWYSCDPMSNKYFNLSPYSYGANNPISNIDIKGKYIVSVHYALTYIGLLGAGISKEQADILAHYSSVYADNPSNTVLWMNNRTTYGGLFPQSKRDDIDYLNTSHSQDRSYSPNSGGYNYNIWHSMMSPEEHDQNSISMADAKERGEQFGWNMIFGSAETAAREGKTLGSLEKNSALIQEWGQGVHALQDAIVHKGRSDVGAGHLWNDLTPDKAAADITNTAIGVYSLITKDYKAVDKLQNITINMEGMSSNQKATVWNALQDYLKSKNKQ